jgi:hypothetical protein
MTLLTSRPPISALNLMHHNATHDMTYIGPYCISGPLRPIGFGNSLTKNVYAYAYAYALRLTPYTKLASSLPIYIDPFLLPYLRV